jgi:hypothetical protein
LADRETPVEQLVQPLGRRICTTFEAMTDQAKIEKNDQDNDDPLAFRGCLVPDEHQFNLIRLRQ